MNLTPRILAIVPARGGSKGVPLKNIREVGGKPLLVWALELASDIPEITDICVSTDNETIRQIVSKFDGVKLVHRPEELSGDRVPDAPVLRHATEMVEATIGLEFDFVIMLQPTSPLRTNDDITECLELVKNPDFDSVWTVSATEAHYHPLKQLVLDKRGVLNFFDRRGAVVVARQELEQVYHRNGACYAMRRSFLMSSLTLHSVNRTAAVLSRGLRVNIDSEEDISFAHKILSEKQP